MEGRIRRGSGVGKYIKKSTEILFIKCLSRSLQYISLPSWGLGKVGFKRKIRAHLDLPSIPRLWGKKYSRVLAL